MTHAGLPPTWTLTEAKKHAKTLEQALQGPNYLDFLTHMYGNTPNHLDDTIQGTERLRAICNYFTRMRFCNAQGHLELACKGKPEQAPQGTYPWYAIPERTVLQEDVVFGHWAALQGHCPTPRLHAIDTGCVWGGTLTALRLHDKQRFSYQ